MLESECRSREREESVVLVPVSIEISPLERPQLLLVEVRLLVR